MITLWSYAVFGNSAVLSGIMRGSGTVLWPTVIGIFAIWGVEVPAAYILMQRFGLDGVWMGYPIAFCTGLRAAVLLLRVRLEAQDARAPRLSRPSTTRLRRSAQDDTKRHSAQDDAFLCFRGDARAARAAHDDRRFEDVGRAFANIGAGRNDFARFELHACATCCRLSTMRPCGFDVVAGEDRREKLDRIVCDEEPFVAVQPDQQFGCNVAEEREHARAVDEIAAVMCVVRAHAQRGPALL